jgi:hypothetical protein
MHLYRDHPTDGPTDGRNSPMLDIVMIAIAAASFAALIGYALLCERL